MTAGSTVVVSWVALSSSGGAPQGSTTTTQCYSAEVLSFDKQPVLSAVDGTSDYAQVLSRLSIEVHFLGSDASSRPNSPISLTLQNLGF